jgi:hypothetical protein
MIWAFPFYRQRMFCQECNIFIFYLITVDSIKYSQKRELDDLRYDVLKPDARGHGEPPRLQHLY